MLDLTNPTNLQKTMFQAMKSGQYSIIVVTGPVRQGKTVGMAICGVNLALHNLKYGRGCDDYVIAGQTLGSIHRNQRDAWKETAEAHGVSFKDVGGIDPCLLYTSPSPRDS